MQRVRNALSALLMLVMLLGCSVPAFAMITKEDAKVIALRNAGLMPTKVEKLKIKKKDKCYEVEFTKKSNGARYEYDIDICSGGIQENEVEFRHARNSSTTRISKAAAYRAVAGKSGFKLSIVKNGTIKCVNDDGEWIYIVRFTYFHGKYEYTVLGPTGRIIEISRSYRP